MSSKRQVLGVEWNLSNDHFVFDIADISKLMKKSDPIKRNVVSLANTFFLSIRSVVTCHCAIQAAVSTAKWDPG